MTPLEPLIIFMIQPLCSTTKSASTLKHMCEVKLKCFKKTNYSSEAFFFHTTANTKHLSFLTFNISTTKSLILSFHNLLLISPHLPRSPQTLPKEHPACFTIARIHQSWRHNKQVCSFAITTYLQQLKT